METELHIGKLIRQQMEAQGCSPSWLAKELNCVRTNIYKIYGRSHIETDTLQKISLLLNYDFFRYFSEYFQLTKENCDKM